jgi:4-hydroxybenzoate polyprenyltransferase/phosphoserine phosphatase
VTVASLSETGPQTPLIVDMDGALLRTDVLFEAFAAGLARRPVATLMALRHLLGGRARFKRAMTEIAEIDVEALPLREDFVEHLAAEKATGRPLHLVTAADQEVAQRVAERVGLFDSVEGSTDGRNLKGSKKLAAIQARFPEGFAYAGDSNADLKVWAEADSIVLAGAPAPVAARAGRLAKPIEARFEPARANLRTWMKALRVHQWSKNALVFVAIVLGHLYREPEAWIASFMALTAMCLTASGTYLFNDLSDLAADRRHRTKRNRPLADGRISVQTGLILAPLLILAGLAVGFAGSLALGALVTLYLAMTLSYSMALKRVPMLDVTILGGLYTVRVIIGAVAIGAVLSPWLLTFSFFFFFAMSLAKRHVELVRLAEEAPRKVDGRGYSATDAPLTLAFGVSATTASILIIMLYMVEEAFPSGAYSAPDFLWAAPVLVAIWTMRIWLLAQRGELHDDPVAFAVRDRVSWALGAVFGVCFIAATVS